MAGTIARAMRMGHFVRERERRDAGDVPRSEGRTVPRRPVRRTTFSNWVSYEIIRLWQGKVRYSRVGGIRCDLVGRIQTSGSKDGSIDRSIHRSTNHQVVPISYHTVGDRLPYLDKEGRSSLVPTTRSRLQDQAAMPAVIIIVILHYYSLPASYPQCSLRYRRRLGWHAILSTQYYNRINHKSVWHSLRARIQKRPATTNNEHVWT